MLARPPYWCAGLQAGNPHPCAAPYWCAGLQAGTQT